MRLVLASMACLLSAAAAAPAAAQSALQVDPDGRRVFLSKDVGDERWVVTRNRGSGTVTGNVFFPGGGEPRFVWCDEVVETGDEVAFACSGADRCDASPCGPELWTPIAQVTLPQDFFLADDAQAPATWMPLASLPAVRQEHPVVALRGEVYVVGGIGGSAEVFDTVLAYDPATDRWRDDVAPLPAAMHHANVATLGGRIWVTGFLTTLDFTPDGRVFSWDPSRNAWSQHASMPAGTERGSSGVAAIGDRIYVAGGLRGGAVTTFSAYHPATDTWEPLPDVPAPLDHLAAGAVGGKLYLLGGRSGGIGGISAAVYEYDPAAREWTRRADMPTARGGVAGATLGGRIFVLGGEGNPAPGTNGVFADVEVYDPAADEWSVLAPMAVPRHGTGAVGLGDLIHVPGGATRQGFGAVAVVDAYEP